jgi:hypothetical protein
MGTVPHPKLAELIYDGQVMRLARWPKRSDDPAVATSWLHATPGPDGTHFVSGTDVTSRGWANISALPAVNQPWAHVVGNGYYDTVAQMTGAAGTAITVSAGSPAWGAMQLDIDNTGRWAAVNLLEELTDQGEYWMDRAAGVVYFRPPGDVNPSTHETVVSALATPLVSTDTSAQYIIFDGLVFEATQSLMMRVAGSNITVQNSTFRNSGGNAILVGNTSDTIAGNKIYDLVGGGVILVGSGVQYMADSGADHATVLSNEIFRVGRYAFNHVPAVTMGGGQGHLIQHNYMHDIPGISLYALSIGATIEFNVFQRTGLHGYDHGAIYNWNNLNANTTIRYNIFRDVQMNSTYTGTGGDGYDVVGIYCDDYSTGYTTYSNIFYNFKKSDSCPSCAATQAIVNKTSGNSFGNSLFHSVWQIYASAAQPNAGPYFSNSQAWIVNYGFPSGVVTSAVANPNVLDPTNGNFSNQPDGTLMLVNGTQAIPALQIGMK